jgi:DNA-directed RNA polymerase II subunit RPB2
VQQVNTLSLQCHVERVNTPVNRDGKYPMMRNIDPTSLFSTCPTKTPEGDGAGLLQTLTIMSHVRVGTPHEDPRSMLPEDAVDAVVFSWQVSLPVKKVT